MINDTRSNSNNFDNYNKKCPHCGEGLVYSVALIIHGVYFSQNEFGYCKHFCKTYFITPYIRIIKEVFDDEIPNYITSKLFCTNPNHQGRKNTLRNPKYNERIKKNTKIPNKNEDTPKKSSSTTISINHIIKCFVCELTYHLQKKIERGKTVFIFNPIQTYTYIKSGKKVKIKPIKLERKHLRKKGRLS